MEIFFCELCARRISPADLESGRCKRQDAMAWCPACTATLAPPTPSGSRAPVIGGTASSTRAHALGATPSGSRAPVIRSATREMRRTPAPGLPTRPPTVYNREPVPAPITSRAPAVAAVPEPAQPHRRSASKLPPVYLAVGAGMLALIVVLGVFLLLTGPGKKNPQTAAKPEPAPPVKQPDLPRVDPAPRPRPPDPPPVRPDPPKDNVIAPRINRPPDVAPPVKPPPEVAPRPNPPAEITPGFPRAHANLEKDLAELAELPVTLPRLLVPRPRGADPVIDGKFDDACWSAVADQKLFFIDGREDKPGALGTFKMLANDKELFFAATFHEDELSAVPIPVKPRDRDPWADDAIEIFMLPGVDSTGKYYQWVTNIAGSTWEGFGYKSLDSRAWNPDTVRCEIKRVPDEKCWRLEIAIPFAEMPVVQDHALWRFNLYRNRPKRPSGVNDGSTAWSPTNCKSTHTPERFGIIAIEAMGGKLP